MSDTKGENLKGVMPAIPSPCTEEGDFLGEKFSDFAQHLFQQEIDGLYVCGATGEGEKMKVSERKEATKRAIEVSKEFNGTIISHVGSADYREVIELAQHAEKYGAEAVASMPPRGCDQARLLDFYKGISARVDIPILIYYHVGMMDFIPTYGNLIELLDIDLVSGIKFTSPDFTLMKRLLIACPNISIFNGMGGLFTAGLLYGAVGGIGTWINLFPKLFVKIYKSVSEGNVQLAMKLQNIFLEFEDVVGQFGLFPVFETIMRDREIFGRCFRHPKEPVSKELEKRILDAINPKISKVQNSVDSA